MAAWGMPVQASRAHSSSVKMLLAQQNQRWEVQPVAGTMEPQVEFIGWQIKPKQEVGVAEELDEESLVTIHITQVALGDAASAERHTVFITNEKGKFAIGTLDRDKPHFSVDFMAADSDLRFSHTGKPVKNAIESDCRPLPTGTYVSWSASSGQSRACMSANVQPDLAHPAP